MASKKKGAGKAQRNALSHAEAHTLNSWVLAHAAELNDQLAEEIVARASAGTGLTLTISNVLTAREATGAPFEVRKKRQPKASPQTELALGSVRPVDRILAAGLLRLMDSLDASLAAPELRALAGGA